MTPKEKAQDLYFKFYSEILSLRDEPAKQCALIAVDELLESHWNDQGCGIGSKVQFYRMVKSEIQKL